MHILQWTFIILAACGCWRPTSWSSLSKKVIYNVYTAIMMFLIMSFTISQFLDIVLNVRNYNDFTENFYMLLATMAACCKFVALVRSRANIKTFMNILKTEPCRPKDGKEMDIQMKFDKSIGSSTICYVALVEFTVICMILSSLFTDFKKRKLAYRAWLPYDYSSVTPYLISYIHQFLGLIICSVLHVACDCVVCGFLEHTCAQIEILEHRLQIVPNGTTKDLPKCIYHHNCIYKFAAKINDNFRAIIFVQFLLSTMVVCFNLFQLTRLSLFTSKYLEVTLYTICMLTQIFFYCWYGNKLKVKSSHIIEIIFGMDWIVLDNDAKKMLVMIMRRAMTPIEFTSGHLVSLNLDSFVALLKTSYSAFNVLQRSSNS